MKEKIQKAFNSVLNSENSSGASPGSRKALPLYFKDKEPNIPLAMSSFGPDGGVVSTTEELITFLKAFFQRNTSIPCDRNTTVYSFHLNMGLA